MPNRILKESICRSDSIDSLSWFEEVLFYRLIVQCDDFGRFDGRPAIIKGACFPLKKVTEKDLANSLNKLSAVGLVDLYEFDGKPYLQLVTWEKHQTVRAKKSKYPNPNESICKQTLSNENNCKQMSPYSYSNSNNDIRETNSLDGSEQNSEPPEPQPQPIITILLNDGTEHPFYDDDYKLWSELYPAVDVMQQLRNMKGWAIANAKKRKTASGIKRFVNTWLAKEQNNGGKAQNDQIKPKRQFHNFSQREHSKQDYEDIEKARLNRTYNGEAKTT